MTKTKLAYRGAQTVLDQSWLAASSLMRSATVLRRGYGYAVTRENIEKKVRTQQQGGIQQFGEFRLLKNLGEVGMGAVYLAEDTNAGRQFHSVPSR
ncbi:MAG: hypothetical protein NTW87_10890 [Planctomycetota bacterium]|nr:hypothetical protein [Planctomycetota bacterium]